MTRLGFEVEPEPLPFTDAIEAFRGRLPLSPGEYNTLSDEARTRAFTLAGVAGEDLIADVFKGIGTAIEKGQPYEAFAKEFLPKLEKAWGKDAPHRLETVFQTNVQSAYQAGHYRRQVDPDVLRERPLWQYDAVNDGRVRPAHRALDGKVVRADDPFWDTHYPPNGWRCRCGVISLTEAGAAERGLGVATREEAAKLSRSHLPDKGFAVSVGKATFGRTLAQAEIDRSMTAKGYLEDFVPLGGLKTAGDYGRPNKLPALRTEITAFPRHKQPRTGVIEVPSEELRAMFLELLGGSERTVLDPLDKGIILSDAFFEHLTLDGRERYLPHVLDVLSDPQEIWLQPRQGAATGRMVLRKNYVKTYELERKRLLTVVADAQRGIWFGYTTFAQESRPAVPIRSGVLLYSKTEAAETPASR